MLIGLSRYCYGVLATPKSGLPGERFPHLGIVASPYLDKVSVKANHSDESKVKVCIEAMHCR